MSIKQHFARWKETEAAKLRPMTAKQRAGYILHYYRFWFIGLALLLLVGFYIGDAVIQSHKEILLQGFFTNDEYNLFPAERIEKDYAATQTLTRQQRIVFDDALYIDLGGEASEYTAASNGKLTAYITKTRSPWKTSKRFSRRTCGKPSRISFFSTRTRTVKRLPLRWI